MASRHKSRELAVQLSYQWIISPESLMDEMAISRFWTEQALSNDDNRPFFENLVTGTKNNLFDIDKIIEKALQNWRMERVEKVELALLRVAVFELCYNNDAPGPVVINEAVEISKKFCSKDSPRFINGILDAIYSQGK